MDTGLKVLIVDDSVIYRSILKDIVQSFEAVSEVQTAPNGRIGLQRAELFCPDLVLSDLEMPVMDGLEFVRILKKNSPVLPVVIVSSLSPETNPMAVEALALGALDFVQKPQGISPEENSQVLSAQLKQLVSIVGVKKNARLIRGESGDHVSVRPKPGFSTDVLTDRLPSARVELPQIANKKGLKESHKDQSGPRFPPTNPSHILIGVSTGGPNALSTIFPVLAQINECPILIVQHIPPHFAFVLAERLQKLGCLKVKVAEEGDLVHAGQVLLSPGGRHMAVQRHGADLRIKILDTEPRHGCKPSVDVLFDSFCDSDVERLITVIMTGMGRDGVAGVTHLRQHNQAYSIIQDEESSVVWGMPKAVYEAGQADEVLSLNEIGPRLKAISSMGGKGGLW